MWRGSGGGSPEGLRRPRGDAAISGVTSVPYGIWPGVGTVVIAAPPF